MQSRREKFLPLSFLFYLKRMNHIHNSTFPHSCTVVYQCTKSTKQNKPPVRSYRPVRLPLTTCTSPPTITRIVNTHFGRWSRLVDVYSTHRWSNEEIETHFARDGGIAPVDVLFNTGDVIRRWHANRKWLLCDVCDKSCSNTRYATILPFFSSPPVLAFSSSSDTVGALWLHLTVVDMRFGSW